MPNMFWINFVACLQLNPNMFGNRFFKMKNRISRSFWNEFQTRLELNPSEIGNRFQSHMELIQVRLDLEILRYTQQHLQTQSHLD